MRMTPGRFCGVVVAGWLALTAGRDSLLASYGSVVVVLAAVGLLMLDDHRERGQRIAALRASLGL